MRCLLTRSWRPRPHWCKLQEQQGWVGFLVPVHPPWMTRHRSCNPADRPNNSSLSVVDQPIPSAHARIHAWDPTIAAECSFQTDLHFAEIFPGNRWNPALDSVVFEPWRFCLTPPRVRWSLSKQMNSEIMFEHRTNKYPKVSIYWLCCSLWNSLNRLQVIMGAPSN